MSAPVVFARHDKSNKRWLDIDQLKQYYQQTFGKSLQIKEEALQANFEQIDLDGDGKIDMEELERFLQILAAE